MLNTCSIIYLIDLSSIRIEKTVPKRLYTDYDKEDGLNRACNDNVKELRRREQCWATKGSYKCGLIVSRPCSLGQAAAVLVVPFIIIICCQSKYWFQVGHWHTQAPLIK